jgi:hypothetical protein
MEKITSFPLGSKFVRQSAELEAIEAKLRRPGISPNHREALTAHRQILSHAIDVTVQRIYRVEAFAAS